LPEQELEVKISAIDVLLSIREKYRRMSLQEYLEKTGLGKKLEKLSRKKDSQARNLFTLAIFLTTRCG